MYTKEELKRVFSYMREKQLSDYYRTDDINTPEYMGKGFAWQILYCPVFGAYFQFELTRFNEVIPGVDPLIIDDSRDDEDLATAICEELPDIEIEIISNL